MSKWTRERLNQLLGKESGAMADEFLNGDAAVPTQLPPRYLDRRIIKNMTPGDTKWTLPWSVMVDADMNVWINGSYPAYDAPGGTVQMQIRHTGNGIEVLRGMEPQRPVKGVPWVGADESDLLPVVKIH